MINKTFFICLIIVSHVFIGCQMSSNSGQLVLKNESNKPFYYKLEVAERRTNQIYSINPDSTALPLLNISESVIINIEGQYTDNDSVYIYLYVKDGTSDNKAELVRGEIIGIRYLKNTRWAPIVIKNDLTP